MANNRPKTSHLSYSLESLPRASATVHYESSNLPEIAQKYKKWETVAKQVNRELQFIKIGTNNYCSHKSLHKVGSSSFIISDQNKQRTTKLPKKNKFVFNKYNINNIDNTLNSRKVAQNFHVSGNNKNKIKRVSKQVMQNRASMQFDRLVQNIGSSMQYQQRLTFSYIKNIQKVEKLDTRLMPIIYSIKNDKEVYSTGMNIFKNNDIPITICLFAECFDAKPEESIAKRQHYFAGMLKLMNGTFDPEIMSKMPRIANKKKQFNHKQYYQCLKMFNTKITKQDKLKLACKMSSIISKINLKYNQSQQINKKLSSQAIQNYQQGLSITNLDYFLKQKLNNKKLNNNMKQFLISKKQFIASLKINYHGGYSKTLYTSWNNYVKNCRIELPRKNFKLNLKVQRVNSWIQNFNELSLVQTTLFDVLYFPLSIQQLKALQLTKIQQTFQIFQNIFIKGVLSILEFNRALQLKNWNLKDFSVLQKIKKIEYIMPQNNYEKGIFGVQQNNESQLNGWYTQILRSRHKTIRINTIQDLKQLPGNIIQINGNEKKKVNKSIQVLINIFYAKLVEKSLNEIIQLWMNPKKPILKLFLIVDRQSLKLHQPQQKILQVLKLIIDKILKKSINIVSSGMEVNEPQQNQYPEFGNFSLLQKQQQTIRFAQDWDLSISYKYAQTKQLKIKGMINKVKSWYHQCLQLTQVFAPFMPFIKLTAKDKIFIHEDNNSWESIESLYLINLQKIQYYREKLNQIPLKVEIGVFFVDCTEPIKLLHERIGQMDYILQQKYLSQIFQNIHEMQQKLTQIRSSIHGCDLKKSTIQQIAEIFQISKKSLLQLKKRTKDLAKHVYFYIEKQYKSATLIIRFTQLIRKRTDLENQIDNISNKLRQDSYFLESKREELKLKYKSYAINYQLRLQKICKQYLQIHRLERYLSVLSNIKNQFQEYRNQLLSLQEGGCKYEDEQVLLQETSRNIGLVYNYWNQMNIFNVMIKSMNKERVKWIQISQYQNVINCSYSAIENFQKLKLQTNQINKPHIKAFKNDVLRNKEVLQYLQILTDNSIPINYFTDFKCDQLLNLTFKQIIALPTLNQYKQPLKQLKVKAKAQNTILKNYTEIKQRFIALKLVIIDFGGCDTLQPNNTHLISQTLKESCFDCQRLLMCPYSQKYSKQIEQLFSNMRKCEQMSLQWLEMETHFTQLFAFYKANDDAFFIQDFIPISETHRKIIKSFDANNSVFFMPTNSYLSISLVTCKENLLQLKKQIFNKFNKLQSQYCRLQLLNHQEMLRITSSIIEIPKYLSKCLPTIQTFNITEQSIDRVGNSAQIKSNKNSKFKKIQGASRNFVELQQPIVLSSRLLNVDIWMNKLIAEIKQSLKSTFINNKKDVCLQIDLLKQQIEFTQSIEQIIESQNQVSKKLQTYFSAILIPKIEQKRKLDSQKFNNEMKIMLFLSQRQMISQLIQAQQNSQLSIYGFEWIKNCRFYNHSQTERKKVTKVQIKMEILNQIFDYNFMFTQKCYFTLHDVLFIGNCIVGKNGWGKKSLIKHYAYLTGNQIFYYQSKRLSESFIENIVNFFKLAITTGGWLAMSNVDRMNLQELKVIAECLSTMNKTLSLKLQKINMFVYSDFQVNPNSKVYFTLEKFEDIPSRLSYSLRPIWMCPPSTQFISTIYSQSMALTESTSKKSSVDYQQQINADLFKIVDFIHRNRCHQEVPLYFAQSMLFQYYDNLHTCFHTNNSNFITSLCCHKFLLPEEFGQTNQIYHQIQNVYEKLKNHQFSIVYMNECKFTNSINQFLLKYKVIVMNLNNLQNRDLKIRFNLVKNKIKNENIQCLILQNGLKLHKRVESEIKYDEKLSNINIIYLQNIQHFNSQQKLRVVCRLPAIILQQKMDKQQLTNFKLQYKTHQIKKISQLSSKNSQLSSKYDEKNQLNKKILAILTKKYLNSKHPQQKIQRIANWYEKLWKKLISVGYKNEVAIIFSIAWVIGNYVSQRQLIKQLDSIQELRSFYDIISNCTNLRQLYPIMNGFINSFEQLSQTHKLQLTEGTFQFKSIIVSSLKLIGNLLKDDIIVIKSGFATQQIVHLAYPESFHVYQTNLKSQLNTKKLLQHTLKIGRKGKNKHIVIHAADKLDEQILQFLKSYASNSTAYYSEFGQYKLFKCSACQFTFTTSQDLDLVNTNHFSLELLNNDIAAYEQAQLQTILKKYTNSSVFCESVLRGIISCYRTYLDKYFWLQYPIRAALKKGLRIKDMGDEFFMWLLRYMFLCIPDEKIKLITEICYRSTPISLVKHESLEYQIQMNTLLQTNNHMEKLLKKTQLEVRKNICKDLVLLSSNINITPYTYEMLYRTFLAVSDSHTILLGKAFTQRYFCLQTIARILGIKILPFHFELFTNTQKQKERKYIILIKESDINQRLLIELQSLICQEDSIVNKKFTIVLKLNQNSPQIREHYKKYPFLKKYFVHVFFPESCKQQVSRNINLVKTLKNLQMGENKYQLSPLNDWNIPPELQVQKSITHYFENELMKKTGFLEKLVEIRKEIELQEFNKYKFYRNLTEQLFYILSMLNIQLQYIPQKHQNLSNQLKGWKSDEELLNRQINSISEKIKQLDEQHSNLTNFCQRTSKELDLLKQKISSQKTQMQTKFNKIYMKLQALGIQQHVKFRQTQQNQLIHNVYLFIATLIKWEPGKTRKIASIRLKDALKDNQIKSDRNKDYIKKILTLFKSQQKKNVHLSNIYIILFEWIQQLDHYYFKNQQQNAKVQERIANLRNQLQLNDKLVQEIQVRRNESIAQLQKIRDLKEVNNKDITQAHLKIESLKLRSSRIQDILKQVVEQEYKLKISKDLAERLYYIPKIIMSKSIFQRWLNLYEDDHFIAKELFLKSNRQQVNVDLKDSELFKYNTPLFHNIFDDFGTIVDIYNKYRLKGMDFDQVKLFHSIITTKQKVQIIEDSYNVISEQLCQICGSYLDYKILDLKQVSMDVVKKQIKNKAANYSKIIICLPRFDRREEISTLLASIMQICNTKDYIKFVLLFEKLQQLSQTDNFRSVFDGKVAITYRRYLRQYVKIVYDREFDYEWQYYESEYEFNKAHKQLFEVVQKFDPQSQQSYNSMLLIIKKLQMSRSKRQANHQQYEEYVQFLQSKAEEFGSFYLLLKYLESVDKNYPIKLFEHSNVPKHFQIALRKAIIQLDESQIRQPIQIMKIVIIHIFSAINFVNEKQLHKFCAFCAFLLTKPQEISSYSIIKLLRKSQIYIKQKERVKFMIDEMAGMKSDESKIQYKINKGNLDGICIDWLEYLIISTSNDVQSYVQYFYEKMQTSDIGSLIYHIKNRGQQTYESHYFAIKTKLQLKNQFRALPAYRCKQIKAFWLIKLRKEQSQKLMQILEKRVFSLKQQVKLLNFFFNESKYISNFNKLKQLSEQKVVVCIFNLNQSKHSVIDQIINLLIKNKSINPLFKIFFITQDKILLKNRHNIDYVEFNVPQNSAESVKRQLMNDFNIKALDNVPNKSKIEQNQLIISSLQVIVGKCIHKLSAKSQKQKIYAYLLHQLNHPRILHNEGNALKFITQYFKPSRLSSQYILEYCKIKDPLITLEQPKNEKQERIQKQKNYDINKWLSLLEKIEQCKTLQRKFIIIIKQQINRIIESLLNGHQTKIVMSQMHARNIVKYGWIKIDNWQILKFFVYKCIQVSLKESNLLYTHQIVKQLKIIGQIGNKRINLCCEDLEELMGTQTKIEEYTIKIKVIQQHNHEPLIEKNKIQSILQHYNVRFNLNCGGQYFGALLVTFK